MNIDYFDRKSVFNSIFRAVLGLSQNWKQGTEISHIASSPTHTYMYTHVHTCTALLPSASPIRAAHLWQLVKLHWHIIISQDWSFTLELILGVVHSRVWTCIMTYVYHYRIIQSYVAALESLCVLPLYPYPSLSPQPLTINNPIIFLLLPLFCLALSLKKKNFKFWDRLPMVLWLQVYTVIYFSNIFILSGRTRSVFCSRGTIPSLFSYAPESPA